MQNRFSLIVGCMCCHYVASATSLGCLLQKSVACFPRRRFVRGTLFRVPWGTFQFEVDAVLFGELADKLGFFVRFLTAPTVVVMADGQRRFANPLQTSPLQTNQCRQQGDTVSAAGNGDKTLFSTPCVWAIHIP